METGKAQASAEFLVTLSLVLILFIIIGFILLQRFNATTYMKFDIEGQDVANSIAGGINEMAITGDGYYLYLDPPGDIQGMPYTVSFYVNESILELRVLDMTWASSLSTPRINCTLSICSFNGRKTTMQINESIRIKIENRDEVIYLKNGTL